jgi:predicted lipoprotein
MIKISPYILLLALSITGCIKEPTKDSVRADDFDRQSMLTNLTDNYIIPGYANYKSKIDSLEVNWNSFKSNPDSIHLIDLKISFENSLFAWQTIAFLEFGPASSIALRAQTNVYPIDTVLINGNINTGVTNLGSVSNYTGKGYQALDYLLFCKPSSTEQITFLSDALESHYIEALILDLQTNASYVSNQWDSYKDTFIANNASNAVGSAVSEMSNAIISHYETFVRKGKIGLSLGIFNGFSQLPLPSHVEGLYSQANLKYSIKNVAFFLRFLNGNSFNENTEGIGLLDYANFVEATVNGKLLSEEVNTQMNAIITYSQNIVGPWEYEVTNNPAIHLNLYQEYQKLMPLLKVDLTSAIGVSISYQDNDGD